MDKKIIINPYVFLGETWVINRYKKIASFVKEGKVLDLGCGNGRFKMATEKTADFYGVDIDEKNIETCKNLGYASVSNININNINQENKLPFQDKYFSTVACLDILEHLYNPSEALKEINRTLEDRGRIIISCPNAAFFLSRALLFFGIFSDLEIPQRIINSHIRFFTIRRLKNILKLCGFETKKIIGATPTPFPEIISGPINILARIWPSLFAYNFILIGEKTGQSLKNLEEETLVKDKSILKQIIAAIKWG